MPRSPGSVLAASTETPPRPPASAPPPAGSGRLSPAPRPPASARKALQSVLRWGLLIGGLIIIADLSAQVLTQRTVSPEDHLAIGTVDEVANYVLFALLGIVVVRDTGLFYMGAVAGAFAALLDAIVVSAAATLAPPAGQTLSIEEYIARNLTIGVLFAGISGATYFLVRRWSNGRRSR